MVESTSLGLCFERDRVADVISFRALIVDKQFRNFDESKHRSGNNGNRRWWMKGESQNCEFN